MTEAAPAAAPPSHPYTREPMDIPRSQLFTPASMGVDDLALRESVGFANDNKWSLSHASWDWLLRFVLKIALFGFVIALNLWWDVNVRRMIWRSGTVGSQFHLNDPVLIALVTTSMANFVALIAIVARHLFPSK